VGEGTILLGTYMAFVSASMVTLGFQRKPSDKKQKETKPSKNRARWSLRY
jgi:hypothetical protein